jgi:pimeloyl-ACP methyl ester carboxylesterase
MLPSINSPSPVVQPNKYGKCAGQFCHLVHVLQPSKDLVSATAALEVSTCAADSQLTISNTNIVLNSKEARLNQQRERAACLLRRILTAKEWKKLEGTGEISKLRTRHKVDPTEFSRISYESIELAKEENRFAVSLLRDAEEALARGELQIEKCQENKPDQPEDEKNTLDGSASNPEEKCKALVCGVCRNVYQLLDEARRIVISLGHEIENEGVGNEKSSVKTLRVKKKAEEALRGEPKTNSSHPTISNIKLDVLPGRGERSKLTLRTLSKHARSMPFYKPFMPFRSMSHYDHLRIPGAFGKVLLCIDDEVIEVRARKILEKENFFVCSKNMLNSSNDLHSFDACVVSQYLSDKRDLVKWLKAAQIPSQNLPIVAITGDAAVNSSSSLGQTMITWNPSESDAALVMAVLKALDRLNGEKACRKKTKLRSKSSLGIGRRKKRNPGHSSAKSASPKHKTYQHDDNKSYIILRGYFQSDECTSFPFTVMGDGKQRNLPHDSPDRDSIFNLIVCHDIFDTQERMEILLQPIVSRHQGIQVLLWNYPGQAFTEFSDEEVLNNLSLANHLGKLLRHLEQTEKGQFATGLPFYMLGYGCGAAIAALYAVTHDQSNLRGLLFINGISFVDPKVMSVLIQCKEVFSCCPESRPDLAAYFYAKYLFSSQYMNQVSASLALNVYTAVHNPISLKGRINLCLGALQHVDTRNTLSSIDKPVTFIHGKDSAIVTTEYVKELSNAFENNQSSGRAANSARNEQKRKLSVMAIDGGHDLFQEKKEFVLTIIEQLLVGSSTNESRTSDWVDIGYNNSSCSKRNNTSNASGKATQLSEQKSDLETTRKTFNSRGKVRSLENNTVNQSFQSRGRKILKNTRGKERSLHACYSKFHPNGMRQSLEQQQQKQKKTQSISCCKDVAPSYPEVKEFMRWRQRRNKDRLRQMNRATLKIQKSARCMIARTVLLSLIFDSAALKIQRRLRGIYGRKKYREKLVALEFLIFLQRVVRTFISRLMHYRETKRREVQIEISKRWLGKIVRKAFKQLLHQTSRFVTKIQCFCRLFIARSVKKKLWKSWISCIALQRVSRGYLGRCKAREELKKYLFSRNQNTGIELARQMLTECRLHATKLHSEIVLLDKEKVFFEEQIEYTMSDISKCEHEVQSLESDMHRLCLLELDNSGTLPWKVKCEARENKIRMDKSFSDVLARISDRRDYLTSMQIKMEENERTRQMKFDEMLKLERKLVVLLDAQNVELNNIRRYREKQFCDFKETRSIADVHLPQVAAKSVQNLTEPTDKQRQEATHLMDSTEAMIKFGFMGMSMTYLGSLNLMKSIKKVAANDTLVQSIAEQALPTSSQKTAPPSITTSSAKWKVEDVLEWLSSLNLGQYRDAFQYGAVDGSLLFALNEEDLVNTLGVEHKLHRKKLLLSIDQLRRDNFPLITSAVVPPQQQVLSGDSVKFRSDAEAVGAPHSSIPILDVEAVFSWVRHQKLDTLRQALQDIPDKRFDEINVRVQYMEGIGTVYLEDYNKVKFSMNKTDDYGNTMLHVAAQNGNVKIAELLIQKGCNPNHQNKQGNTPGHFAIAYKFYDFATWFFDDDGGGGNDLIFNSSGLGAYDGIAITNEAESKQS